MRRVRAGAGWLFDLVGGGDWRAVVAVALGLVATWLLRRAGVTAWWVLPVVVAATLAVGVAASARRSG